MTGKTWAFIVAACLVACSASVVARAAEPPTTILGTFEPTTRPPNGMTDRGFGATNQLYADPGARRLYAHSQVYRWLAAYDLDTLRPVGNGISVVDEVTAVYPDPVGGGLWLATVNGPLVRLDRYASGSGGVVKVGSVDLSAHLGAFPVAAVHRTPGSSLLWVVAAPRQGPTVSPGGVVIAEVDLTGFPQAARVTWTSRVAGCNKLMQAIVEMGAGFGYVPASSSLYFGCAETGLVGTRPPLPRGTGRLAVRGDPQAGPTAPGEFTLYPYPGEFSAGNSLFDPGSGRLAVSAYSAVTSGASIFVFDGPTNSYVGGVGAGENGVLATGIDAVHGRVYGLSPSTGTGLVMADLRPTPVSQGTNVAERALRNGKSALFSTVAVDPTTRRFFVLYSDHNDFLVIRDNTPAYTPASGIDPDRSTTDVEEAPGRTEAAYSSGAQGYGSVVRQVGGWEALVVNNTGTTGPPEVVAKGTREMRAAYLNELHLANEQAQASVIASDLDDANTGRDFKTTTAPASWPYQNAECTDFGDSPGTVERTGGRASCHAGEHVVEAAATYRGSDLGVVSVEDSFVEASSKLDRKRGMVAITHARARGISVGGVLQIGEVDVVAEAWARGRPGTANTSYRRQVKDVVFNGTRLCTDDCDPIEVAKQVNAAVGTTGVSPTTYLRVDFPEPDPTYRRGSRMGYQAVVQALPTNHLEDMILNEQPEDRLEVPGMAILVSQDNLKPGRTLVRLAGAAVEAHYGISLIGDDGFADSPALDGGSGLGALDGLGGDGGPLFGLAGGGALDSLSAPTGSLGLGGTGPIGTSGRVLLNSVGSIVALFPVWAWLLAPIYLSARRWLLLQRGSLQRGVS